MKNCLLWHSDPLVLWDHHREMHRIGVKPAIKCQFRCLHQRSLQLPQNLHHRQGKGFPVKIGGMCLTWHLCCYNLLFFHWICIFRPFWCLQRSLSPYQSPVRQAGKQMIRDGSFSPARKPRHDSLETSEEGEEPKYARLNWNLTSFWLYFVSYYNGMDWFC